MKNRTILATILAVLIMALIVGIKFLKPQKSSTTVSLYSWSMNAFAEKKQHLFEVIEERGITDLYQDFTTKYLASYDNTVVSELVLKGIKVYHLAGHPSWGYEEDARSIIEEIDKVVDYNAHVESKIEGIVLDIEPYLYEGKEYNFEPDDLEVYAKAIQKGYEYAKEKKLKYVICIPTWYDTLSEELTEKVISNADRIEAMNYVVKDTLLNIQTEVEYAKKYDKEITTIYEVNFNYNIDEDDERTGIFYSYKEMLEDFKKIKENYKYDKLYIGYHYFAKM